MNTFTRFTNKQVTIYQVAAHWTGSDCDCSVDGDDFSCCAQHFHEAIKHNEEVERRNAYRKQTFMGRLLLKMLSPFKS